MRLLVTGANGFVGTALCQHLLKRGVDVVGAVRTSSVRLPAGVISHVVGEIGGQTDWRTALVRCDSVVHLAGLTQVRRESAGRALDTFRAVNVAGTLELARQAAQTGVRRIVFVSSIKVNGERTPPDRPFAADDPPAPEDAYALSKLEAERILLDLAEKTGMEVLIVRPPLVYGPGVKGNFAALVRAVRRRLPLPFAAVNNRRSLIALDNLVSFLALCADAERSPAAANEVFLVADGEDVSTPELIRRLGRAYGAPPRLVPVPPAWLALAARVLGKSSAAERLVGSLRIDDDKARTRLAWQPVVTMEEQLCTMARHDQDL